jgi:hypothetical protein
LHGFFALSFLKGLEATDHSHGLGVQMAFAESFWMISEGKIKLGIGNFSSLLQKRYNCKIVL